jgi:hypothetical protein
MRYVGKGFHVAPTHRTEIRFVLWANRRCRQYDSFLEYRKKYLSYLKNLHAQIHRHDNLLVAWWSANQWEGDDFADMTIEDMRDKLEVDWNETLPET